jgi:hypothetical protein
MDHHPAPINIRAHRRLQPQRGASFGAVLIVIVLIVFFANLAVKMLPAYFTFMQVRSAISAVQEKPDVVESGPRAVLASIAQQLYINDVRSVKMDAFKVERTNDGFNLNVAYDVQQPLFYNVDVIMHFAHSEAFAKP